MRISELRKLQRGELVIVQGLVMWGGDSEVQYVGAFQSFRHIGPRTAQVTVVGPGGRERRVPAKLIHVANDSHHAAFAAFRRRIAKRDAACERIAEAIGVATVEHGQQIVLSWEQASAIAEKLIQLRGWMPKWRRGAFGVTLWSLGVPNGDQRFDVWRYAGQWFWWGAANGTGTPATDREAAMRAAEAAAGLPQCEVCDEP